ncbi:MAG: hypothetical protein WBL67_17420 [Nitrososphaeraceae archaeon]
MKSKSKLRLHQDKSRICRQIGILPNEEPVLITERKQMRSKVYGKTQDSKRIAGYGECFYPIRTIFVDCSIRLKAQRWPEGGLKYLGTWNSNKQGYDWKLLKQNRTYIDVRNVLVHELVHYRFAYLQHGKKFEQRIKEILRGKTFEPKHVHLFSHMPKSYRAGIDDDPIVNNQKKRRKRHAER